MTTIDLKDLVAPKFQIGQRLWLVRRDYNQNVEGLYPVTVNRITYAVEIQKVRGEEVRADKTVYHCGSTAYSDSELIASLDELHPNVRNLFQGAAA